MVRTSFVTVVKMVRLVLQMPSRGGGGINVRCSVCVFVSHGADGIAI